MVAALRWAVLGLSLLAAPVAWGQTGRAAKFARVERLALRLPELRAHVASVLAQPRLDRATAVAAIVRIMDSLYVRVGSERYTRRARPSFGASSLHKEHVAIEGDTVRFRFPGKSRVFWDRTLVDPLLARALEVFLAQPGERLFQVVGPGGEISPVTAPDVRELLDAYGAHPKDLRTLHANRLLALELDRLPAPTSQAQAQHHLALAVRNVARALGHTPAVCRGAYLDPQRLSSYAALLR